MVGALLIRDCSKPVKVAPCNLLFLFECGKKVILMNNWIYHIHGVWCFQESSFNKIKMGDVRQKFIYSYWLYFDDLHNKS